MGVKKERRTAVYDSDLKLEACRFQGIVQPFPNHFHDYYVIGLVEAGERRLVCWGREYGIKAGDVLLFNPGDNHACQQVGGELDYRSFHISKERMLNLAEELTGRREPPVFSRTVICDGDVGACLRRAHEMVMEASREFEKEEALLLLLSLLFQRYGQPLRRELPECGEEVRRAFAWMEAHYDQHIRLEELGRAVGLSQSTLLRAFTREKGITPYSCLMNIRVGKARQLLEQGIPPAEAAVRTGFSDQSHFTHCFVRFIGVTPGIYREMFRQGTRTEETKD